MDQLIALMYQGLSEERVQVGGVFESPEDENEWYVPLLCQGEQFIMVFANLNADPNAQCFSNTIRLDSGHTPSQNAYSIKYAAAAEYLAGNRYAPLNVDATRRQMIRCSVPARLVLALKTFMIHKPHADEFYFFAGADDDERFRQLNLWYHRIGGRLGPSIGFSPVHLSKGDWHGYRKN